MRLSLSGSGLSGTLYFTTGEGSPPAVLEISVYTPVPQENGEEIGLETSAVRYLFTLSEIDRDEIKYKRVQNLPAGTKIQEPVRPRRVLELMEERQA